MQKKKKKNTFISKFPRISGENIKKFFHFPESISISQKQKIQLFDSLYNLINSGIPITNSLSILLFQTKNKDIKYVLETTLKDISKWKKMEDCLKNFPKSFNNFDIYMVRMWEVTGKVAQALETIKEREEKNAELKTKVIWALIYPAIIVSLSIAMIIGFMLFVIPRVQKMYADAKVSLPDLTQNVIDASVFLQENYILLMALLIITIVWIMTFKKHPVTQIYYDYLVLKIPIFWPLMRKKILAIFSHTLGTLLQNGIMINEALDITKKSLDNIYYEKRIEHIWEELSEWIALSESMWIKKLKDSLEDPYFPLELASIVKIWEQTGKLPNLLIKISQKFNKEIDIIVKGLSTAIEPIVIIAVGAIVGTMVMAILLPFFNMVNVL